jgi:hypothetical protein
MQNESFKISLTLADFVSGNNTLPAAFETVHITTSKFFMFGGPAGHSFTPHIETAPFHVPAHQFNNFFFAQEKLKTNCFERSSILPCHFDDSVYFRFC